MFSSVPNGSKIALLNLVARLWKTGFKILDVQFLNDHLLQFGAHEISKNEFQTNLREAIQLDVDILSFGKTDDDFSDCLSTFCKQEWKCHKLNSPSIKSRTRGKHPTFDFTSDNLSELSLILMYAKDSGLKIGLKHISQQKYLTLQICKF